jgi:glutamyl-tRNA reductase
LERLRSLELERHRSRLSTLTAEQRQAVEELTGGLMSKILHHPIQALKRSVRYPEGPDRARFFREVFGIDDKPEEAGEGSREEAVGEKRGEDDSSDPT